MTQHILLKKNALRFFCTPTYPEEITNIVKKANSKKSSGFDNVDPYIMKQVIPQIANQLAHIFNNSLMCIVPSKLKIKMCIKMKTLNYYQIIDLFLSFHASQKY